MRTGDIVTERREIPTDILLVTTYDNVDLKIVQDTETYAEVRSGENLLADITFTIKGNGLEIANTSKCNWARSYDVPREVTLHVPQLRDVRLNGYGNISSVGVFRQDTLFLHLLGAGDINLELQGNYLNMDMFELGDITLRGTMEEFTWVLGGNGRLFAHDLQTRRNYFKTTRDSNGDAHVRAQDIVGGSVEGTGTVYYSGNPATKDLQIKGFGSAQPE
ncbi:DUF2807 domain-containing protein [Hymenobacter sp. ASUV-10]|uniref:DUF2807 domain-containing protein n=1 Tax=Hymenobacter aranciens TaxID=3063996 RepID=A0ABT9BDT2_9BACT|nr:DUF2807 domain-containing protein [Hymenobacter sp. ASUV-10]MDO7876420.1 DUF2807 domain-containing protein [Hymenobacter sp. ASUV-10]